MGSLEIWLTVLAVYFGTLLVIEGVVTVAAVQWLAGRGDGEDGAEQGDVTVVITARNEATTIGQALDAFGQQTLVPRTIVVVDDGSTDNTADTAAASLAHAPYRGIVLAGRGRGKAEAIRMAQEIIDTEFICFADADTRPDRDALTHLRAALQDNGVQAVSAWVWPEWPDARSAVARILLAGQTLEYARAIAWRGGLARLGLLSNIEGRLGMFRGDAVRRVDVRAASAAVDYALSVGVHRYCAARHATCRMALEPRATVWTHVPSRLGDLIAQRRRWARGLTSALVRSRSMILNPTFGRIGMLELPLRVFVTPMPVLELILLVSMIAATWSSTSTPPGFLIVAGTYFGAVAVQLALSLALCDRHANLRRDRRDRVRLWMALPFVALLWEPLKGLVWLSAFIPDGRTSPGWIPRRG